MTSKTIELSEANFENIEACATIGILGKRRTGKTTWAKFILQSLSKHINRFVAICGNKDNSHEWKEVIHELYITSKSINYLHLKKVKPNYGVVFNNAFSAPSFLF